MTITTRQRKPKTFRAKFKNVKDWRRRNWGWTKMDNKLVKKTVRLLRQDNLVCCSDGSVNFGCAAHRGTAPVDGPASALNSTRAEIMGIIACVSFVTLLSKKFGFQNKTIVLYTDSEASISCATMTGLYSTKYSFHTDVDAILELQECLTHCPHTILLEHVEGHQNKHTLYHLLDFKGKLNVQMDRLADKFIRLNS